ncbi:MAG: 5-(carboxyamino)imidazole ribonucleotide synthase [Bacteroidetes bacterium]|nr:5-(carboxyamino)imidazole ribonucleotide synthase [Bacteroidota bacterium]
MKIGILGGGQLARMMIEETAKFGFTYRILSDTPNSPAGQICETQVTGKFSDYDALKDFASECDVITLENEFIDSKYVKFIEDLGIRVLPGSDIVALIQDKLLQKQNLKDAGVPVPAFTQVAAKEDVVKFAAGYGYPVILKSRTMGYDGKGNYRIDDESRIEEALKILGQRGKLMCEEYINFKRELAVQGVRGRDGEIKIYPVVESIQKDHICNVVKAKKDFDIVITEKISLIAENILKELNYTGVLAIELFEKENGDVLVNELAPRVHNTGHYTTEGCYVSQFENHIRAVAGIPLGSTEMKSGAAVMINILGERDGKAKLEGVFDLLKEKNAYLHVYGKAETRKGRKMGHITVTGDDLNETLKTAEELHSKIRI